MTTYAIGDLQGCHDALMRLLDQIAFNAATDRLWLVGDLVNRGPQSLQVLRELHAIRDRVEVVLGNHDLHLLATSARIRKASKGDTFEEIFSAPDGEELLDWLRHRRLAVRETIAGTDYLMVHAGIVPNWTAEETIERAGEVETVLQSPTWREALAQMYGDEPDRWSDELTGAARRRVIINILTRIRYCDAMGTMNYSAKEGPAWAPAGMRPWFEFGAASRSATTILFGHWAALGFVDRPDVLGLDSGCVWGGCLTAVDLETRQVHQTACPQYRSPG